MARSRVYQHKARQKEFLLLAFEKVEQLPISIDQQAGISKCYFCKRHFTETDFPAGKVDNLTIHHIDEDRTNNKPENKALAHRGCHIHHHSYKRM